MINKNIKMIITRIKEPIKYNYLKNEEFQDFYKEFEYGNDLIIIDIYYLIKYLSRFIVKYKYLIAIFLILIFILIYYKPT
jgi:hypothetical protein